MKQALQMALEYISWHAYGECRIGDGQIPQAKDVTDAIREALKQEPVAWMSWSDKHGVGLWESKEEAEMHCAVNEPEPLYREQQ